MRKSHNILIMRNGSGTVADTGEQIRLRRVYHKESEEKRETVNTPNDYI